MRFLVVGTGPLLDKYIEFAEIYGVGQTIEFSGAKYGPELAETLRRVDIMVNPSVRYVSETFCIANVEAMASGLPIVSFGIGGTGEYLVNETNSILVDDISGEGLADAVLKLSTDGIERCRLGGNGAQLVRNHFSSIHMAEKYAKFYDGLFL